MLSNSQFCLVHVTNVNWLSRVMQIKLRIENLLNFAKLKKNCKIRNSRKREEFM